MHNRTPRDLDAHVVSLTQRQQLDLYALMLLTRALDDRQLILTRQGAQGIHLSSRGHEASAAASALALDRTQDILVPSHRSLAAVLAFGVTPEEVLLQCLSKASDPASGGRSMPNHYGSARHRILNMSSPIGTQIPHAAGAALAARVRHEPSVTLVYFGDGASSKSDFHEGVNFAVVHRLAVVFVCENNGWSISVPTSNQMSASVAARGKGYGLDAVSVDGTDPLEVYAATHRAVARARAGAGPTLLESRVERLAPHSSDDDDTRYRPASERTTAEARDPLPRFAAFLKSRGHLTDAHDEALHVRAAARVEAALQTALTAPEPNPAEAHTHLFATRDAILHASSGGSAAW